MSNPGLQVATPTDTTIVFTRTFAASRPLVWDAMTKPELLQRWMFCPPGWSWRTCEMDVRAGGTYRWAWNGPDGALAMTISGVHREVTPPSKIVHTERMEMGPAASASCPGGSAPGPWELLAAIDLTERDGVTTMTMTLTFDSKPARDGALASGMQQGMEAGYMQLDSHFECQVA